MILVVQLVLLVVGLLVLIAAKNGYDRVRARKHLVE